MAARLILSGVAGAAIAALTLVPMAFAYTGQALEKDAKVKMAQAQQIALKAHPGTITDEELEQEKGGSGLRYSFDIKDASGSWEVGVDAMSGRVLENSKEGAHPD
jgi:uncharacterized membrane protein YkoI